ncbi:MAG: GNAT family N-acetyltransferase [Candidatus Hodarchaeota archaeon]
MATVLRTSEQKSHLIPEVQQSRGIHIRSAHLEDLERLGDLWLGQRQHHQQWDDLYATSPRAQVKWKEQIHSALEQLNHCIFIAEDTQNKVVGYIHGSFYPWPFSPNKYYGSLNTIAIAEEVQGQGIGKKLVHKLLCWFKYQQINFISVHVDHRNWKALNLYQKVGFRAYQHRLMLDLGSMG